MLVSSQWESGNEYLILACRPHGGEGQTLETSALESRFTVTKYTLSSQLIKRNDQSDSCSALEISLLALILVLRPNFRWATISR